MKMRASMFVALAIGFAISGELAAATQSRACQSCITGISNVHAYLGEVKGVQAAQEQACFGLPGPQKEMCRLTLTNGLPVLEQKTQDSAKACGDLGFCNATEVLMVETASGANDLNCELCEYVMAMVKEQLEDPQTEADLLNQAEQICSELPGGAKTQCLQYVTQYGKQIFDWVHQEKPDEMCMMASFCPPETFPRLPPKLLNAVSNALEVQDDDQCNTCQLVVVEASSMLSDPSTQKEILDYIKKNCENFQAFADQCATYIDLYGPLVLNMAKDYLKPELCTQLGFCGSQSSQAYVSVV